jgi:hypothetical protein
VRSHIDRTYIETATLAEFDSVPAAVPPDPEAISWRAAEPVADLVEPAKSDALETLDGTPRPAFLAVTMTPS